MKRFIFPLDSYRDWLRSQLDAAEARLADLRGAKKESLQASDALLQQRQDALAQLGGKALDGGHLASLDAWRSGLAQKAEDAVRVAVDLDGPIQASLVSLALGIYDASRSWQDWPVAALSSLPTGFACWRWTSR